MNALAIDPRCRFHAVKKINNSFARKAHLGPVTKPQAEAAIAMNARLVEAARAATMPLTDKQREGSAD